MKCTGFLSIFMFVCLNSIPLLGGPVISTDCMELYYGDETKQRLHSWAAQDSALGVPEAHRRYVVTFPESIANENSMLAIHGLYNSPLWMKLIADIFQRQHMNSMVSRLSGHYESNANLMKRDIRWQTWLHEAERDLALAQKLGKKVVLAGHSTGALMLVWSAMKYPDAVKGMFLISPAFGVLPSTDFGAWFGDTTGITIGGNGGRLVTGHAGLEVGRAMTAFKHWLQQQSNKNEDFSYAAEKLRNIPIWIGNTCGDYIISQSESDRFFQALKQNSVAARQEFWVPLKYFVKHDAIGTVKNPHVNDMLTSMESFLLESVFKV